MKLPRQPKWDRIVDGLEDGYKWATDYERSLLPSDTVFPQTGQVWEAIEDCEVSYVAFIPKTILPAGISRLKRGERVQIISRDPEPVEVQFRPLRYDELHSVIVPKDVRERSGYLYYWLALRLAPTPCCLHKEPGFFVDLFRLNEGLL